MAADNKKKSNGVAKHGSAPLAALPANLQTTPAGYSQEFSLTEQEVQELKGLEIGLARAKTVLADTDIQLFEAEARRGQAEAARNEARNKVLLAQQAYVNAMKAALETHQMTQFSGTWNFNTVEGKATLVQVN